MTSKDYVGIAFALRSLFQENVDSWDDAVCTIANILAVDDPYGFNAPRFRQEATPKWFWPVPLGELKKP